MGHNATSSEYKQAEIRATYRTAITDRNRGLAVRRASAKASSAPSAARTLSSCVLGPRKKLSDKTRKKQKVLFLPKYISVPPNVF